MCVHIQYIYIGEYVQSSTVCVCMSVYIWALFKLRECLIPASVCVFLFILMQSGDVSASTAAGYQ